MSEEPSPVQTAIGSYIAQADHGSTASLFIYQHITQHIAGQQMQARNLPLQLSTLQKALPHLARPDEKAAVQWAIETLEKLTAALPDHEQSYRERIKARFAEEVDYFVPLSCETSEVIAALGDELHVPRSNRRRRYRVEADYHEWVWMAKEQEIKRVKLNSLTEGVNKYPCIILLGDPGSGKTTALKNLAYHFAGEPSKMPLFLRLGEFRPGLPLEDFILDSWAGSLDTNHWNAPELGANLEGYLEAGKLFFLFDGLNEMPHQDYSKQTANLRRFIDKWQQKGNCFVVTCRLLDYSEELAGLQRVEIQPLSDDQIRSFLMKDPSVENWEALWQTLIDSRDMQRRLLGIARNPYLLTIMIDIFGEDRRLSQNRAKLMTRFIEILMSEAKKIRQGKGCRVAAAAHRSSNEER